MITSALLNFAYFLLFNLLSIFPTGGTFSSTLHDAIAHLGAYLTLLDPIAPLSTLLTLVMLSFSVELAFFAWRALRWLISFVPLIGGNG